MRAGQGRARHGQGVPSPDPAQLSPLGRAEPPATPGSLGIFSYLLFLAALHLNHHNDPKLLV